MLTFSSALAFEYPSSSSWSYGNGATLNFTQTVTLSNDPAVGVTDDANLVGYWKLNEGSGNIAADYSAYGLNGTISGATWADGKFGGALRFNAATGNNVVFPSSSVLAFNDNSFSMAAWVYISDFGDGDRVTIFGGKAYLAPAMVVFKANSALAFAQMGQETQYSPFSIPLNSWTFLSIVVNKAADTVTFTVNDQVKTTALSPKFVSFSGQLSGLGTYVSTSGRYMNGLIDDARVYNRVLNYQEVQALYLMGPYGQPDAATFANYLNFNDTTTGNTMLVHVNNDSSTTVTCSNFFTSTHLSFKANNPSVVNLWTNLGKPVSYSNSVWNIDNCTLTLTLDASKDVDLDWNPPTKPSASNVSISSTAAGEAATFSALWKDKLSLSGGGYIFSTNNTGTWVNSTWVAFTSNPGWGNATLTLNSTTAATVSFREYANDTYNLWGASETFNVTLTDPTFDSPTPSPTAKTQLTPTPTPTPTQSSTPPTQKGNPLNQVILLVVAFVSVLVILVVLVFFAFKKGYLSIEPAPS
jgi:hypothetical protein